MAGRVIGASWIDLWDRDPSGDHSAKQGKRPDGADCRKTEGGDGWLGNIDVTLN